ncbi:MAG TPA: cysteine--tRNA ligase, partial [Planctomycetota bacterium]|nr:cysteine--tRNA ligase [Planctomycetota bacterium]
GHVAGPILFDAVARWLRARGFAVRFVNNITDIDDKIINRSIATGEPWDSITRRYTAQYLGYLKRLHVVTVTDHPRCSDYIPPMITYIQDLIAKGRAYVAADGVYYDVEKQNGYGKLSGRKLDEMKAGARIERNASLHHPADFALWKQAKPSEPSWDSPWGKGRPGWHIECSVMSHETLGETFDIHGGGDDLKFPHHENEIAQGEAHGGGYARCWMHNDLIQYDGVKVGKSDPRMKDPAFAKQFKADFLLDTYGAATVRFLLMQGHYRRPNDFAPAALSAARTALGKLHRQLGVLLDEVGHASLEEILARPLSEVAARLRHDVVAAMDDDFNTGAAIAALFGLMGEAKRATGQEATVLLCLVRDLGQLIGLFQPGDGADTVEQQQAGDALLAPVMDLVLSLRQEVRARRDFATSDRIRDTLATAGITLKDAKDGATWASGAPAERAGIDAAMQVVIDLRGVARTAKDFATADRIRQALSVVGITVADGPAGATWAAAH